MLKTLTVAIVGTLRSSSAWRQCGCQDDNNAQSTHHPVRPARHAVTGYPGYRLWEGRSIYRMQAPGTFYGGTDERGYPSGEPQNPRTGD